jgi:hypothetical protein
LSAFEDSGLLLEFALSDSSSVCVVGVEDEGLEGGEVEKVRGPRNGPCLRELGKPYLRRPLSIRAHLKRFCCFSSISFNITDYYTVTEQEHNGVSFNHYYLQCFWLSLSVSVEVRCSPKVLESEHNREILYRGRHDSAQKLLPRIAFAYNMRGCPGGTGGTSTSIVCHRSHFKKIYLKLTQIDRVALIASAVCLPCSQMSIPLGKEYGHRRHGLLWESSCSRCWYL